MGRLCLHSGLAIVTALSHEAGNWVMPIQQCQMPPPNTKNDNAAKRQRQAKKRRKAKGRR